MKIKVKVIKAFEGFEVGKVLNLPKTTAKELVDLGYAKTVTIEMPKANVKKVTRTTKK